MNEGSELKEYEMVQLAKAWREEHGKLSPSFLQRKLKISYNKAIELITIVTENK